MPSAAEVSLSDPLPSAQGRNARLEQVMVKCNHSSRHPRASAGCPGKIFLRFRRVHHPVETTQGRHARACRAHPRLFRRAARRGFRLCAVLEIPELRIERAFEGPAARCSVPHRPRGVSSLVTSARDSTGPDPLSNPRKGSDPGSLWSTTYPILTILYPLCTVPVTLFDIANLTDRPSAHPLLRASSPPAEGPLPCWPCNCFCL